MSNELTLNASLAFTKGSVTESAVLSGLQFNVAGTKALSIQQTIATSATALNVGDIVSVDSSTPGYMLIQNLDPTNYVTIRAGSAGADVIKLNAGEFALFRLATSTPYAIANSAAVFVQYTLVET